MKTFQTAIRLSPAQRDKLSQLAKESGCSQAEIIRRCIDMYDVFIQKNSNNT